MRKYLQKTLVLVLTVLTVCGFYTSPVFAANLLKNASVTLSNPKQSTGSAYTFSFKPVSGGTAVKGIRLAFRQKPSGDTQFPTGIGIAAASFDPASFTVGGAPAQATWAIDKTNIGTGVLILKDATGDTPVANTSVLQFTIGGITNPAIVDSGDTSGCIRNTTNASAGMCYINVQTFDTDTIATMQTQGELSDPTLQTNMIDMTTVSFAVTSQIEVSARVDSSLSFTVEGIAGSTTVASAGAVTTTTATSTFNNLPFGNLTVGTPKLLAQNLYVKTNAQNGYSVKLKSTSSPANPLNGVYTAPAQNKIDPFNNNGNQVSGSAVGWTNPGAWATPTSTTANDHSGFMGASTSDTDIWAGTTKSGAGSDKWAPIDSNFNEVMKKNSPDLGDAANLVQITFAVQVNVYQPADNYTGQLQYNCVPTY